MVKAGVANFLMNFTAKPTIEEEVVVTQVGDCDEVERYLHLLEIPLQIPTGHDQDILYWWKAHATEVPNLSKMARQFLAAPASSAAAAPPRTEAGDKLSKQASTISLCFIMKSRKKTTIKI